jgi:two-component system phosphate regulon sensor histidine kinase PhoR
MGSLLRRSLYLALFWRIALGVAVVGVATLVWPHGWTLVLVGLVAALWVAWRGTRFVTNALEMVEPVAASIGLGDRQVPVTGFRQMEGLVDALQVSAAEVARQLGASSESRRKLEALLDSMQDAVTSVDAAGRIVWANQAMKRLIAESCGRGIRWCRRFGRRRCWSACRRRWRRASLLSFGRCRCRWDGRSR